MKPSIRHAFLLSFFALCCCAQLAAQTGSLTGRITDAESGKPLSGATIRLSRSDAAARQIGAISGPDGYFTVKSVAAGTYKVVITFLSYAAFEQTVEVKPGQATLLTPRWRKTSSAITRWWSRHRAARRKRPRPRHRSRWWVRGKFRSALR
ncbi:MAG: TonB-dependent receptor [Chlorobi bacterium OLB7]|nr:MAG: TonB-dependent receptor [Chlorobi bacterium OLB7]